MRSNGLKIAVLAVAVVALVGTAAE